MALFYHVRPMDLHRESEWCNHYDCSTVVMKHEYDAVAKDAARYRWIRSQAPLTIERNNLPENHLGWCGLQSMSPENLDHLIDGNMAADR